MCIYSYYSYIRQTIALSLAVISFLQFGASASSASLVLDSGFRAPLFAEPNPAQRTVLLPDGKFLVFYNTDTLSDQRSGAITRYLADGTLDSSFNFSPDYKFVSAATPTSDGHLIIAAVQYTYNSSATERVLRLNQDGSIDSSFHAATVLLGQYSPIPSVRSILVQPDSKILLAGSFDGIAEVTSKDLARLLPDGTVDSTFTPAVIWNNYFYGVYTKPILLDDGKIFIAGDFGTVDGVDVLGVVKLNADGSHDPSFVASGFTRYTSSTAIRGLGVQSDGKVLIAGRLRIGGGGGAPRVPIIRLNADGTLDSSYLPTQFSPNDTARDLKVLSDDKALVAINDSVYRLETTGIADATFSPPTFWDTSYSSIGNTGLAITVNQQLDGRILVGGIFTDVNPVGTTDGSHYGFARLNSDGTVDPTLTTSHRTGVEDFASSVARLSDGSVWSAFRTITIRQDPSMHFNLGRLLPSGILDQSFSLSSSDPGGILSMGFIANDFVRLPDGNFFIFGQLGSGKFLSTGVQDLAFHLDQVAPYFQKATVVPSGKILLSAGTDPSATLSGLLSQIRRDGTLDYGFRLPPSIGSEQVVRDPFGYLDSIFVGSHVVAVQPDGKILYLYLSSSKVFQFVRLNAGGSIDDSFSGVWLVPSDLTFGYPVVYDPLVGVTLQPPGGVWNATPLLQDAQIQPDGRIILCGPFTSYYSGVPARGIVRLLPNGDLDDTFDVGGGPQWIETTETASLYPYVEAIEEQVDGKLLVVGPFEAFDGVPLPGIASLNPDGSVDTSFVPSVKRQKFVRGTTRLSRQPDGSFLLSGPYSFLNENNTGLIRLDTVGGVPVVGAPLAATAAVDQPFSCQVEASGQPTNYAATGLPSGFNLNPQTGVITGIGTAGTVGIYSVLITASNNAGSSSGFYLTLSVTPAQAGPLPTLRNISTRLKVLSGDNALIGGFIISGSAPRQVIVRAVGPSLTTVGISGALADPVLELHGPDPFVTITNDNWKDTQESEIEATNIPPTNDLESAIVATLDPGAYTAIVRGKSDGIGVGLVEAYDLESTSSVQLANISTRGFVDAGENVMIGGLIAGPDSSGSGRALIRAIGPSLTALGVPNALQDPMLELHDSNGGVIATNHNWRDTQGVAIKATGIAPTDDNEAAILSVLSPGSYTAVVSGEDGSTGVGLVEVYNLN